MKLIKYNINNINDFLDDIIIQQENIYSIIDKQKNTDYVQQLKDKKISITDFFNIIEFGKYTYYQFNSNNNQISDYNRMIPFTIIKNNENNNKDNKDNNIYLLYAASETNEESKKVINKFIDDLTDINYDLSKLRKIDLKDMPYAMLNDSFVFIYNNEYYKK